MLNEIYNRLSDDTYCVINPTDSKEIIDIKEQDKVRLKKLSMEFFDDLNNAIKNDSISDEKATELIQKNLGVRFPGIIISPTKPSIREVVFSTTISNEDERKPSIRTRAG